MTLEVVQVIPGHPASKQHDLFSVTGIKRKTTSINCWARKGPTPKLITEMLKGRNLPALRESITIFLLGRLQQLEKYFLLVMHIRNKTHKSFSWVHREDRNNDAEANKLGRDTSKQSVLSCSCNSHWYSKPSLSCPFSINRCFRTHFKWRLLGRL